MHCRVVKRKQGEKANRALRACLCNIYNNVDSNPLFCVHSALYVIATLEWLLLMGKLMLSVPFRSSQQSFLIFHQSLRKKKPPHLLVCIISRLQEQCQIPLDLKALSPHRVLLNCIIHFQTIIFIHFQKSSVRWGIINPSVQRQGENWLCCRFLDFLVPERGIRYPGLNPRTQSPVGEKKIWIKLSKRDLCRQNKQVFFVKSVILALVALMPPHSLLTDALCSL